MTATLSITKAQRDAIHDLVLAHLECIGGLRYAIEREEFAAAESMGLEFGADLRLMEDLGWGPSDHETMELTMPAEDIAEVLVRLRGEAEAALAEEWHEREGIESDAEHIARWRPVVDTCNELLDRLDPRSAGR
jgi:hypothetical protein